MPDLSSEMLPVIRGHRLPGLNIGDDFIYPDYSSGSVLNLPSSVCRLLGVPDLGAGPLRPEIMARLPGGGNRGEIRKVLLILVDALSLKLLQGWIASGRLPLWGDLAQQGVLAPITSIVPSTTSAVLPSLWSGRSSAEHGIVGYEMWLKEYGVVANMIAHAPMAFQGEAGSLSRAGFTPENYLPFPTLGTHFLERGVEVYAFQHISIARSGLSQMFFKDVKISSYATPSDLWVNVRQLFEERSQGRFYSWVYWGELDHLSHFYGPEDERTAEEFASFSAAFERLFLNRLGADARRDSLVILIADHGQVTTRPDPHYNLSNHPNLARRLHILPTGENRMMYLFIRPGQTEAVREYIERSWPRQFAFLDPAFAVDAGLFGPGTSHPRLPDRLGDLLVVARGQAYLWWSSKEDHLFGRHGGLAPDEMLVPFLAVRL